jgi:hypothetical protein
MAQKIHVIVLVNGFYTEPVFLILLNKQVWWFWTSYQPAHLLHAPSMTMIIQDLLMYSDFPRESAQGMHSY